MPTSFARAVRTGDKEDEEEQYEDEEGKGAHESGSEFKERMRHQKKSKRTIMPKGQGEPAAGFSTRCEIQLLCSYVVHSFDSKREDPATFLRRLQACKAKCGKNFEPGDTEMIDDVLGPPPKEKPPAKNKPLDSEEEELV